MGTMQNWTNYWTVSVYKQSLDLVSVSEKCFDSINLTTPVLSLLCLILAKALTVECVDFVVTERITTWPYLYYFAGFMVKYVNANVK